MSSVPNETDSLKSDVECLRWVIRKLTSPEVERGDDPEWLTKGEVKLYVYDSDTKLSNELYDYSS